jgi:hypothetical protein
LLLQIDKNEKEQSPAGATIEEATALSDTRPEHQVVTPNEKVAAPQVVTPRDSASAAEELLGKYARRTAFVHDVSKSS